MPQEEELLDDYGPVPPTRFARFWLRWRVCWRVGHDWQWAGNTLYGKRGPIPPLYECRRCGRITGYL